MNFKHILNADHNKYEEFRFWKDTDSTSLLLDNALLNNLAEL